MARQAILMEVKPYTPYSLSASAIALYQKCPAMYYWRYALKNWDEGYQHALAFGTMVHAMIETHYKMHGDPEAVKQTMKRIGEQEKMQHNLTAGELKDEFITAWKMYQENIPTLDKWFPAAVEVGGKGYVRHPETNEPFPVQIGYKIDLETVDALIIDHKTTGNIEKFEDEQAEKQFQLDLYSMLYFARHSKWPKGVGFNVLVKDMINPQSKVYMSDVDQASVIKSFGVLQQILADMKAGKFQPHHDEKNPAKWCDFCANHPEGVKVAA